MNLLSEKNIELFESGIFNSLIIEHLKKAFDSVQIPASDEKDIIIAMKNSLPINSGGRINAD